VIAGEVGFGKLFFWSFVHKQFQSVPPDSNPTGTLTKYAKPLFGKDCALQESRVQPQFDILTFQELRKMMLKEGFIIMVFT
jgi:hypothetical protein